MLRRRTGFWGAVGNLSEDGDLCLHRARKRRTPKSSSTRGAHTTITSSKCCPEAFARWRAVAHPHWSPPQELRTATLLELVGMRAAALRARLLNSALSVRRSGACDELNLLINARMGVGHAGVTIERSSSRQRNGVAVFLAHGKFSDKKKRRRSRLSDAAGGWWQRPGVLLIFFI